MKPCKVLCHPLDRREVQGAIEGNYRQLKHHGYDPMVAGAQPIFVDMGKWWYALGGWERSAALQQLREP